MADSSVAITAGAGTSVDTRTEGTNSNHRQVVVLGDPDTNAGVAPVDATYGVSVDVKARAVELSIQPVIDTAVYASGDRLGAVGTFTSAARTSGGTGTIVGARLVDDAASNFDIELWLFKVSPTLVNADNGVFDITDANIATALYIGTIDFLAANTKVVSTSSRVTQGTWLGGPPALPFVTSGSANIFGIMKAMGAYDAAATDDLVVYLNIIQD